MKLRSALVLLAALAGCGKEAPLPDTIPALRDDIRSSRDAAKSARAAKDPKKADKAALRAEAAAKKAGELRAKLPQDAKAEFDACAEAQATAQEARYFARIADEEMRLEDIRGSLKGKAYRAGRKVAWPATCKGLAAAADQAAAAPDNAVADAAGIAVALSGRPPRDGKPDWPGVAADLKAKGPAPSTEESRNLAVAFLFISKNEFALFELETTDPSHLPTDDDRTVFHIIRGLIFSRLGMPLLAAEEIERSPAIAQGGGAGMGPEILAGVHLALAFVYLQNKDNERADREIALSIQSWPDNPVAIVLTGERQAANGEYEKAAVSMETAAAGTEGEWLAKRLSERARELRDNPGKPGSILHDPAFQREVLLHYMLVAAKRSEKVQRVQKRLAGFEGVAKKVVEHLPGGGN